MQPAIGVFDSGIGGLTVLRAIRQLFPAARLVYLGDTARVPYGTKSPATVLNYAQQAATFLLGQKVDILVVACNTASAVALDELASELPIPVIGVIEPGASAAVQASTRFRIGVIGTEGTIQSGAYERSIRVLAPDAVISTVACPLFVPIAEVGWADHQVAHIAAAEYLAPLQAAEIDTLVLGCTHYPLLQSTLCNVLGPDVVLVDSALATARALQPFILADGGSCGTGAVAFFVTDAPQRFCRIGGEFLGTELGNVQQVVLEN